MTKYFINHIQWDAPENVLKRYRNNPYLPTKTTIITNKIDDKEDLDDILANILSDKYGYCIKSFVIEQTEESNPNQNNDQK